MKRCSQDYAKVYHFIEQRMTLTDSQKFCQNMSSKPASSDLVAFGSCDEYLFVQSFLLDIAKNRHDLWDLEDGTRRLETWTNSDKIPPKSPPDRGRLFKRSTDSTTDAGELIEDETDVSTCSTNNTYPAPPDPESPVNSSDRNLTTSFRAWDSNDETEVRYPICQMKFDHSVWESGSLKLVLTLGLRAVATDTPVAIIDAETTLTVSTAQPTTDAETVTLLTPDPSTTSPAPQTTSLTSESMPVSLAITEFATTEVIAQVGESSTTDVQQILRNPETTTESPAPLTTATSTSESVEDTITVAPEIQSYINHTEGMTSSMTTDVMTSPSPQNLSVLLSTMSTSTDRNARSSDEINEKISTTTESVETTSMLVTVSTTESAATTEKTNQLHDSIYDDASSRITGLKEKMRRPNSLHGTQDSQEAVPQKDTMEECNEIANDLLSHYKRDQETSGDDVQAFIRVMGSLHSVVTDTLNPEMEAHQWKPGAFNLPSVTSESRKAMAQQAIRFSQLAVDGFSTLLQKTEPWTRLDHDNRSKSAIAMVDQVHHLSFTLGCMLSTDHHRISQENIMLEVFGVESGIIRSNFSFPQVNSSSTVRMESEVRFTSDVAVRQNRCGRHIASGIIYQNLAGHMMPSGGKRQMNSQLVSFSLSNSSESMDLVNGSKVQVIFRHLTPLRFGDVSSCVFWDVASQNWSSHRCEKLDHLSSRNLTVCQCDHLTNFAVLMDISSREEDDEVKNLLTTICSSLSIACLIVTIACLAFVKSLRNRRSVITANLSACLLISNLLVLFGFDQTQDLVICRIVSGLTLYSLLSAFMWMLMEGYLLYQMIILVFRSVGHLNTLTIYCLAYIPPAVVLAVFVGVTGNEGLFDPEYAYFCWISNSNKSSYIWSFAGPALAIVFVNAVILTKSFIAAIDSQNKKKPSASEQRPGCNNSRGRLENIRRWLKGWTSLLILVGLTWLSGLLYIHESVSWLSYPFICLNGLQGLFIFLFEILLNGKTRKSLIVALRFQMPNASKYLPALSKTSSNNLSNASKTTRCSNMTTSATGSQSNLSRNIIAGSSCTLNFCAHVVTEPDGKDFSPHHLFHHHHEVPKLIMHEKFTPSPDEQI